MEENGNMEQSTQSENMGKDVQGTTQDGKGNGQKLFTQEEVNGFVQSRVGRLRGQIEKEVGAEYEKKMSELQAREMKLLIKEQLDKRNMPRELADIITCTDENDLKVKLDALQNIYGEKKTKTEPESGFRYLPPRFGVENNGITHTVTDPVRRAMGLDRKDG